MAGVHVVIDCAAALPRGAAQDLSISRVQQSVRLGDRLYHADAGLDTAEVLDALRRGEGPLEVLAPTAEDYAAVFDRLLGWGVEVVSLHPAPAFGASAPAARQAAAALPVGAAVSIVETPWFSCALGLAVVRAAHAGAEDLSRDAVVGMLARLDGRVAFAWVGGDGPPPAGDPDDVDVPPAGGRARWELEDGRVRSIGPAPDLGAALRWLAGLVLEGLGTAEAVHLALVSAGADAETAAVATFLESRLSPAEVWIAPADPVTVALAGPGAFGVAWYTEEA